MCPLRWVIQLLFCHFGRVLPDVLLWHYGTSPCDRGDVKHLKLSRKRVLPATLPQSHSSFYYTKQDIPGSSSPFFSTVWLHYHWFLEVQWLDTFQQWGDVLRIRAVGANRYHLVVLSNALNGLPEGLSMASSFPILHEQRMNFFSTYTHSNIIFK